MIEAPVPAVLALWQAGYTASWIADVLNLDSVKPVQGILAHAREIGDRRAVIHTSGGNSRKNADLKRRYPWLGTIDVIDALPPVPPRLCRRGHRLTRMNTIVNPSGPQCRRCKNIIHQRSRARIKERMECRAEA